MSKKTVTIAFIFGIVFGIGASEIFYLTSDYNPGLSYPKDCLLEETPKFDKSSIATVFDGSIMTIRLCGLNIGDTYFVTSENGGNVTLTAELQAELVFVQVEERFDGDGLATFELRNETMIFDTHVVSVTRSGGVPSEQFVLIGVPLIIILVIAGLVFRTYKFLVWLWRRNQ